MTDLGPDSDMVAKTMYVLQTKNLATVIAGNSDHQWENTYLRNFNKQNKISFQIISRELSSECKKWLSTLKPHGKIDPQIGIVHGNWINPINGNGFEGFFIKNRDYKVILHGHTRLQYSKEVHSTLYINPGSVGRPKGSDSRSAYALLYVTSQGYRCQLKRIEYDIKKTQKKMIKKQFPKILWEQLN